MSEGAPRLWAKKRPDGLWETKHKPTGGFAALLQEARIRRRLTQAELGEIVGIEHSYVSRLERSSRLPSIPVLYRLAHTLFPKQPGKRDKFILDSVEAIADESN